MHLSFHLMLVFMIYYMGGTKKVGLVVLRFSFLGTLLFLWILGWRAITFDILGTYRGFFFFTVWICREACYDGAIKRKAVDFDHAFRG